MRNLIVTLVASLVALSSDAQELTRLLRQPAIHGSTIAFSYAGDLWIADLKGGDARRLTSGEGTEYFPHFSPDGSQVAFTGEYSGSHQVFVMPTSGGQPKQLTFYNDAGPLPPRGGIDNRVLDWSPDGSRILFNPHRLPWNDRMPRPFVVPATGGMETPLPIPEGSGAVFSPDGTKVAYTPIERETRTWKRYRGGRAQDIWLYDLETNKAEQITNTPATDNQPMWIGDTIYFTSDREDGRLNLWAYDLHTKRSRKLTSHLDYDVLWPSSDRNQIIYECGGYLWHFDPSTGKDERIPIHVVGDFKGTLPRFRNVKANIESFSLSPTGARALFTARGDVFSVPAKHGEIRDVTQTPGIRERDASWSPDGRWMVYLSDSSGDEYEVFVRPTDGSEEPKQLTTGSHTWYFAPKFSPDSRMLAFGAKDHVLRVLNIDSGRVTEIDHSEFGDIAYYAWSPDSRWLTYTRNNEVRFSVIYVHSMRENENYQLTSGTTDDNEPTFDPSGRYLYFTSNRDFNLTFSAFEFNYIYTDPTRVYVATLTNDSPALFLPRSDEEKTSSDKEKKPVVAEAAKGETSPKDEDGAAAGSRKKDGKVVVHIDPAGFESRVRAIPAPAGNYRSLRAVTNGVFYISGSPGKTQLKFYDLDERKEETYLDSVSEFDLSSNGEKLLTQSGDDYAIVSVKGGQKSSDGGIALDRLEMKVDPRAEWAQEYNDGWRLVRDFFYDPNTHGVDWNAMRTRYGQLVPFIAHRADLDFILGELVGELSSGHTYIESSAEWQVKRSVGGLLGADIVSDASGYFRVQHIFAGENWHEYSRSPLTEPGVKVREGDLILAVDGISTKGVDNFYRLLENKSGQVVTLQVNSSAELAGSHEEKVRPIVKETGVRYVDWVQSRRDYVEKASGGRIGYIHVPNTAEEGNRELFRGFYPNVTKEALIIDDRYNGGGFIPDRMIELLDRPLLNYWIRRGEKPSLSPAFAHEGPKVCLINGYSASGGDALPYFFRKRGLGKLIGTRTWGGLIGLSGNPGLVDGGQVEVPQSRFLDTAGMWAVEGSGVSPDIEVVDRPDLVAAGQDPTLERAVAELLQQLKDHPPQKVAVPLPPVVR